MSSDIKPLSVYDADLDLFESQYTVDEGISYNSYLILDDKTALMDTVDARKADEWQSNLLRELDGRDLNYLIVQHLEPDHASQISWVMTRFHNCRLVATATALKMLSMLFDETFDGRTKSVGDGDTLSLGSHSLSFATTPMVHWPEVMMTYDATSATLFSADAFGRFGNPDPSLNWDDEARRYYYNIVGKYGAQVQNALKKLSDKKINTIAPLHGPVIEGDIAQYVSLYNTWSSYSVETPGIFIAYASMHGMTARAANTLADTLRAAGATNVVVADIARTDMAKNVETAFRMSHLVVAAPTYDADIFPPMFDFIHHLSIKGYRNRTVAIIENGMWAPVAGRKMHQMFESMKGVDIVNPIITLHGRPTAADSELLSTMAKQLLKS